MRVGFLERVEVGGVLWPDDDVRLDPGARCHLGGEVLGALRVQVQDRRSLSVEVQPGPRDVSLDAGDLDRPAHRRQWHEEPASDDRERSDERATAPTRQRRTFTMANSEEPTGQGGGEGDERRPAQGGPDAPWEPRVCENASRAQGNPPYGVRSRNASWATHRPAMTTGAARVRQAAGRATPSSAMYRAWRTVSAIQGKLPT